MGLVGLKDKQGRWMDSDEYKITHSLPPVDIAQRMRVDLVVDMLSRENKGGKA